MVAIKNLNMPSCCQDCELWHYDRTDEPICNITYEIIRNFNKKNDDCPLVNIEPNTGYWIERSGYDEDIYYDCSVCGERWCGIDGISTDNLMCYCPSCGAKMKGIKSDEDNN